MPFGIFSMPNTSTQSYWPARIAPGRELEGGAAARAAGLHVDDRHARARERAEHLVARRDAAVRRAAERGVEPGIAGLGQRGAHRVHAHGRVREPVEPPERMDARPPAHRRHARDVTASAALSNAHVVTVSPFSSGSVSATSRIGWPNARRAGSASVNRVITRSCSCDELDHAEAERDRSRVAGRRGRHRGPRPQRGVGREQHAFDVGRAGVRARVEQREVEAPARGRVAADERDGAVVVHLEQTRR